MNTKDMEVVVVKTKASLIQKTDFKRLLTVDLKWVHLQ